MIRFIMIDMYMTESPGCGSHLSAAGHPLADCVDEVLDEVLHDEVLDDEVLDEVVDDVLGVIAWVGWEEVGVDAVVGRIHLPVLRPPS
jgi:hypothetical protein